MSDQWELFRTRIEDCLAVIVFNDGVADEINDYDLPNLIRLQIAYNSEGENGLPEEKEHDALFAIEDMLELGVTKLGGCYVGRVSAQGRRTFFFYCTNIEDDVERLAAEVALKSGYEVGLKIEQDPKKNYYWDMLYPSRAERQTIQDIKVIDQLLQHGESLEDIRQIEHFAYFENQSQAEMFANWAKRTGYKLARLSPPSQGIPMFSVVINHQISTIPDVICRHTVSMAVQADSLGGEYDGWETALSI